MEEKMEIKINKLIRSKRKTLALEISHDGSLIVRAPAKASMDAINVFINKKRSWIRNKQEFARQRHQKALPKEFVNGEGFFYLGEIYKLWIVSNADVPLIFKDEFLLSRDHLSNAMEIMLNWYKDQARSMILERVKLYSSIAGIAYNKFNISDARTRWGSCSAKGNMNFSWRLIMAPLRVIDYVVVHELAHQEVKNHSRKFWDKVKAIFPDYEQCRRWLKENGHLLLSFDANIKS